MLKRLHIATWIVLFVCFAGSFGVTAWTAQKIQSPSNPQRHAQPSDENRTKENEKSFWQRTTHDPVAAFTGMLALFTAVLTGVSIIQIRFLNSADQTARITAEAAKAAADAATQQAKSMVAIELPILMIEEIKTHDPPGSRGIEIKLGNYGRTPAIIIADCLEIKVAKTLPLSPVYPTEATLPIVRDRIVELGDSYSFARKNLVSDDDWERIRKGETILWAYGYVEYLDFFKRVHRDGFCIAFIPTRKTLGDKLYTTQPPSSLTWARTGPPDYTYSRYKTEEIRRAGLS